MAASPTVHPRIEWANLLHAFKTALASAIAWELSFYVLDHKYPTFAPLGAILTIQLTIFESYLRGIRRVLGVVLGVAAAVIATHVTGTHWWSVGLVIFLTLAIGSRLNLGSIGLTQIPISALLVMVSGAGTSPHYAIDRILDTAMGSGVAVFINVVLWPPQLLPNAEKALLHLVGELAGVVQDLGTALEQGAPVTTELRARAQRLDSRAHEALDAATVARGSLRWHPLAGRLLPLAARYQEAAESLEHATVETRGMVRALLELPSQETKRLAAPLAKVLEEAADGIRQYGRVLAAESETSRKAAEQEWEHAREGFHRVLDTPPPMHLPTRVWIRYGSVLVDLERLLDELGNGLRMRAGKS